jgi:hypothetical protein
VEIDRERARKKGRERESDGGKSGDIEGGYAPVGHAPSLVQHVFLQWLEAVRGFPDSIEGGKGQE